MCVTSEVSMQMFTCCVLSLLKGVHWSSASSMAPSFLSRLCAAFPRNTSSNGVPDAVLFTFCLFSELSRSVNQIGLLYCQPLSKLSASTFPCALSASHCGILFSNLLMYFSSRLKTLVDKCLSTVSLLGRSWQLLIALLVASSAQSSSRNTI